MSTVIVVLIVVAVVLISMYAILGRRRGRSGDVAEPGVAPEVRAEESAGDAPPTHSSGPDAPEKT